MYEQEVTFQRIKFCKECKQKVGTWGCGIGCKWNIDQKARPVETQHWKITRELYAITANPIFVR